MTNDAPVLIMAGGTGGHVFPGLAVAACLREQGVPVVWLGTRQGMEARLVPDADIAIEWLKVRGLRNKGLLGWLLAPLRLSAALIQAVGVVRRHRPRVVLGLGGYVAGPGGVAAWLLRRPLVIHEQNAIAGLTNRLLSRLAREVLCGFPTQFPGRQQVRVVGNPVRQPIRALPAPEQRMNGRDGRLRLLVVGGSLGALVLNQVVPDAVARLSAELRPAVRHQAGARTVDIARAAYQEKGVDAEVSAFIDDMAAAYAWADLVICRAGALTVSELAAAGVAACLVPLPIAVDDHQTANARYLSDAGAAVLIPQPEFTAEALATLLNTLERDRLRDMAVRARALAHPDAAAEVAARCLEVAA
ncbi:MAG: undecaprenyldiphospho-muramoylpentapeptide beta-N-acetylglucosaminyltransferase [Aquisalimonadaceae bacterium]